MYSWAAPNDAAHENVRQTLCRRWRNEVDLDERTFLDLAQKDGRLVGVAALGEAVVAREPLEFLRREHRVEDLGTILLLDRVNRLHRDHRRLIGVGRVGV